MIAVHMEFLVLPDDSTSKGGRYVLQCLEADERGKTQVVVISHHRQFEEPKKSEPHGSWTFPSTDAPDEMKIAWHADYASDVTVPVHTYKRIKMTFEGTTKTTNVFQLMKRQIEDKEQQPYWKTRHYLTHIVEQ